LGLGQLRLLFNDGEIQTLSPTQREELTGMIEQVMTELSETIKKLQDA
jgi:hypothetical protein